MEKIQWTSDQEKIIRLRGTNILVSAAAGSGKTAVLVERIFQRITDPATPVDIDRFVVVTFTRAAASQMKDKLRERFEEALSADPENRHLQRQISLIPSAHISTVHSFCLYIIQNYFDRIGFDPAARQGSDSELALLKKDTMEVLLEEEYEEASEDFLELADMHLFNRSDEDMEDLILTLYEKAMSEPFPRQWIGRMEQFFQIETAEEWHRSPLWESLKSDCLGLAEGLAEEAEELLRLCRQPAGPYMYEECVVQLKEYCLALKQADSYEEFREIFRHMEWKKLSSKRDDGVNRDLRENVKERRNQCKKFLEELQKEYFFQSVEEHIRDLKNMSCKILTLLRLAIRFMEEYEKNKRDRGLMDYNDLEQLALTILLRYDEETGEYVRTEAARELAEYFEEIMIDEYQDSNRVQDTLLASVSRQGLPGRRSNLFMVGDVKQSIYRFRNACPELFGEKLLTYGGEENDRGRRVDLHENFRSRVGVLEGSNCVFSGVMRRDIGGVEYDEDARLVAGRTFEDSGGARTGGKIEVCVVQEKNDPECEARLAVQKIREFTDPENPLWVQEDRLRPAMYRDIVILVRSLKRDAQVYFDVLTEAGIPVIMDHTQGFFDTREISLMTQMLQVIDNPLADYPLAGVLCSPMFHFTEEELARIRARNKKGNLYRSLVEFIEDESSTADSGDGDVADSMESSAENSVEGNESDSMELSGGDSVEEDMSGSMELSGGDSVEEDMSGSLEDRALKKKTRDFLELLERLRGKTAYAAVADMVQDIYDETGIYERVQMMADGVRRTANMDSLMEQAREFDGTTYHGLHQFVRYLSRIRDQAEQMGEVNISGEEENVVRIMTIHKSKGLEFPVCMILGAGKKWGGGSGKFLTVCPDTGIASRIIDNEARTSRDTIFRKILKRKNDMADLGEEMRVLYVAMTRAKEKLVIIGSAQEVRGSSLNYLERSRLGCYFDMIFPAALSSPEWFDLEMVEREELVADTASDALTERIETESLYNFDTSVLYDKEIRNLLQRMERPGEAEEPLPVKVSVSDLKVKSMEEMELQDFTVLTHEEEETERPVPAFMQGEAAVKDARQGAAYGTIWHQVMASIDFARTDDIGQIRGAVADLVETGKLRPGEEEVLNYKRLFAFFESPLGRAMKQADREGRLHRERPFIMGLPAREVFPEKGGEDTVLVQGIIDGYYETGDGIVLLDYKTDSLKDGGEQQLIDRYRTQMALYKTALERMLDRPVARCVLYSFSLGREVECPAN